VGGEEISAKRCGLRQGAGYQKREASWSWTRGINEGEWAMLMLLIRAGLKRGGGGRRKVGEGGQNCSDWGMGGGSCSSNWNVLGLGCEAAWRGGRQ